MSGLGEKGAGGSEREAAAAAAAALLANRLVASGGGRCLLGGRCRYVPIPPALDPLGGIDAFSLAP